MAAYYDPSGRQYDAVQLLAPSTVNGTPVPAGYWIITDEFGERTYAAPDAFAQIYSPLPPASPLPAPDWTILFANYTGIFLSAGNTWSSGFLPTQGYGLLMADLSIAPAGGCSVDVTYIRAYPAPGGAFLTYQMEKLSALTTTQDIVRDFGAGAGKLIADYFLLRVAAAVGGNLVFYPLLRAQ